MDAGRCSENLERLCHDLDTYSGGPLPLAGRLSESLYLAHSTSRENFSNICAGGCLLSVARLATDRGTALAPDCTEQRMGTAGFVFFYVSAFRYPGTFCGLLFAPTLEVHRAGDGVLRPATNAGMKKVAFVDERAKRVSYGKAVA